MKRERNGFERKRDEARRQKEAEMCFLTFVVFARFGSHYCLLSL